MNSTRLAFIALTFLITFALWPVHAGSMGNGAAQRMKLVVDSVDVAGGTVVLKSGVNNSVTTYKIDAATQISVGRGKGTLDEVKPGMKVVNYRSLGGPAPQKLSLLMVYPAAPAAAAPANP